MMYASASILGLTPLGFIAAAMAVFLIVFMAFLAYLPVELKKKVQGHVYCTFLTKTGRKLEKLLPVVKGQIQAPPSIKGKGMPKTYLVNRDKIFHGMYPPIMWKYLQVECDCAFYDEGDAEPLWPTNVNPVYSPELIRSFRDEKVTSLVMKSAEDMSKNVDKMERKIPLLMWGILVVLALAVVIDVWVDIQGVNSIQHLLMWLQGTG